MVQPLEYLIGDDVFGNAPGTCAVMIHKGLISDVSRITDHDADKLMAMVSKCFSHKTGTTAEIKNHIKSVVFATSINNDLPQRHRGLIFKILQKRVVKIICIIVKKVSCIILRH